jgi:uncharacterized membrane protein YkgB
LSFNVFEARRSFRRPELMSVDGEKPQKRREKTLGEKIVQKLNYLLVIIIILAGLAVLSGVFFSEGGLGGYRVVFGVVILAYGLVRLWTLRWKDRREKLGR